MILSPRKSTKESEQKVKYDVSHAISKARVSLFEYKDSELSANSKYLALKKVTKNAPTHETKEHSC